MKAHQYFSMAFIAMALIVLSAPIPSGAQSNPPIRVVRLSFVEGNVTMQRPGVQSWAVVPANTPLQQGFKLSTGENSFAEIQLENGSALRLGERSLIDLTELAFDANGGEINRVDLHQGYATFHPLSSHSENSLQVETPLDVLTARGDAEFRVDLDQSLERVEIFNGSVEEASNLGSSTLEKDSVLVIEPGAANPTVVTQGITQDDWDQWVADRESRTEMATNSPVPSEYSDDPDAVPYGWSDLAQNGVWTEIPGEGSGWSPTVPVGWSPYSSGQWCWYPGWGFTWIGSEPWGWLPYHYGGWEFVPGKGWVWFPGTLKNWSPGRVIWYQGPDWVGWIPSHPHHRSPNSPCATNCGGGVVSNGTFRSGGILSRSQMLGINPMTGTSVKAPRGDASNVAMLPGPVVALPASQGHGFSWSSPQPQPGSRIAISSDPTSGPRHHTTNHHSSIVYDPQQGTYVNSRRTASPTTQPASPSLSGNALAPSAANPGSHPNSNQPIPVEGRQPIGSSPVQPEPGRSNTSVYAPARQAASTSSTASTPTNSSNSTQPSGGAGQAGTNRSGGWAPAAGRASSPSAGGGGHSTPPPASPACGGSAGAHH